jgi:KUP system potassium uptake protein
MSAVKSSAASGPVLSEPAEASRTEGGHRSLWGLTLGSVGVVYGDIGTSPLYAFREALAAADQDGMITRFEVYGVLSLILWALVLIVTVKYVLILLRADNRGEGGTLALMALARTAFSRGAAVTIGLGIVGAALFYGDAIITPAISVLSAVEGLKLVEPGFEPYVLPITLAIIAALFLVQNRGTGRVAAFFGPITAVWFIVMGAAGAVHIFDDPAILNALNPWYAALFLVEHGQAGLIALGAVFLAVTGAEALYADLGHFGRRPIRLAWFVLVLPALALNYLGQGALVLSHPETIENPFFLMVPPWALVPMVLLATLATVIASQAVITGAFSLSRQAVQLGLLPRLEVRHTSEAHAGQIYVPQVNMMLFLGVVFLVMMFGNSGALASAYGIAVTGTMVVTVLMAFVVVWKVWKWPLAAAIAVIVPFLVIDVAFLTANLLKIHHGGWVPLLVAGFIVLVMVTWRRGSRFLIEKTRRAEVPLADLIRSLEKRGTHRVPGTAVFLTSDPDFAPTALMHNLKHNKVLHEHNVILTIVSSDAPRVPESERVTIEKLSDHFGKVTMQFGFVEEPNVPRTLQICRRVGWKFEILNTSFFLSRRSIRPAAKSGMPLWQDRLFIILARNASDATDYFQIPTDRVVEIGMQVTV